MNRIVCVLLGGHQPTPATILNQAKVRSPDSKITLVKSCKRCGHDLSWTIPVPEARKL